MIECPDELRGLGARLDFHSVLEGGRNPESMREAAAGVRAVAMQVFMTASRAAGISARLHAWADIVGIVDPPDDGEPGEGEQGASAGQGASPA
jgi:hypothetical protein